MLFLMESGAPRGACGLITNHARSQAEPGEPAEANCPLFLEKTSMNVSPSVLLVLLRQLSWAPTRHQDSVTVVILHTILDNQLRGMGMPSTQKILFIAYLENLQISAPLDRGEKVGDQIRITNDVNYIMSLLTERFRLLVGKLEESYFEKSKAVVYSLEDVEPFQDDPQAIDLLDKRLGQVRIFLQMLWLVKDNSVNVDLGYLEAPYISPSRQRGYARSHLHRNSYSYWYSSAQGTVEDVTFSREELRTARRLFYPRADDIGANPKAFPTNTSRWIRAHYFTQAARANSNLGVKIANYCTAFESLFSTDPQELSHKLSERIACFLESKEDSRISLYREIKKAYYIRSAVVHGSAPSKKQQRDIVSVAVSCDEIIRRLLRGILEDKNLHKYFLNGAGEGSFEDYLLSLVLKGK